MFWLVLTGCCAAIAWCSGWFLGSTYKSSEFARLSDELLRVETELTALSIKNDFLQNTVSAATKNTSNSSVQAPAQTMPPKTGVVARNIIDGILPPLFGQYESYLHTFSDGYVALSLPNDLFFEFSFKPKPKQERWDSNTLFRVAAMSRVDDKLSGHVIFNVRSRYADLEGEISRWLKFDPEKHEWMHSGYYKYVDKTPPPASKGRGKVTRWA